MEVPRVDAERLSDVMRQAALIPHIRLQDHTVTPLGRPFMGPVTAGLYRVAGTGDDRGTAAYAALRWAWVFPGGLAIPVVLDPQQHERAERQWGMPISALAHQW